MDKRLPPLPAAAGLLAHEDGSGFVGCYTAVQMRAYAAEAVIAERARCARIVRESASVHGMCCADYEALAELVAGLGSKT